MRMSLRAGWDLLLPWSWQRAAGRVLWSQAASRWYVEKKAAGLGRRRAAGQDGAGLAEPAGRGSCWWLRKRLAAQVVGLEQESWVSVEFPCCFPPPSLSSLLLLGPFPPQTSFSCANCLHDFLLLHSAKIRSQEQTVPAADRDLI